MGAAEVDITPERFPVLINGAFFERTATKANDRIHARAIVLDDSKARLAIVVVDSCMVPRELIDRVKELAARTSGIRADRILISSTHTHSAPASMALLGTRVDPQYPAQLVPQLVRAIEQAAAKSRPATVAAGATADPEHTYNRRWIYRTDRIGLDPFGERTIRANMHPGYMNSDVVGPSGPVDDQLSLVSFRDTDGAPIAVLANYSMHYFDSQPVSADYFGAFDERLSQRLADRAKAPPPVVIMSQGTSGDLMWLDYGRPKRRITIDEYTDGMVAKALTLYESLQPLPAPVTLAMAETRLRLKRRTASPERTKWAEAIVKQMGDRMPATMQEVYAKEVFFLHDDPQRELVLQALRIGDLGIAAIPNEVFAITGLKIKAQSPLARTFNIELAGGGEGYIPPPEQHRLGGYTTWPARSASLEVSAEPRIVEAVLTLLERVAGKPRRAVRPARTPYALAVLAARPRAYFRLSGLGGALPPAETTAVDMTGHSQAHFAGRIAFGLDGPPGPAFAPEGDVNRAVHFAGGTLQAHCEALQGTYTVELWLWNGLPVDARDKPIGVFRRGPASEPKADMLAIGGRGKQAGQLIFTADDQSISSERTLTPRTWHHVVLCRKVDSVEAFVDGARAFEGQTPEAPASGGDFRLADVGGDAAPLEGKLDEIAIYDRALTAAEVESHFQAAGH